MCINSYVYVNLTEKYSYLKKNISNMSIDIFLTTLYTETDKKIIYMTR